MTRPLAKWLMQSYAELWIAFKSRDFDHDQASKIIKKKQLVSPILSELKRYGWLTIKLHPEDSRKRIYQLISPDVAIKEMAKKHSPKTGVKA